MYYDDYDGMMRDDGGADDGDEVACVMMAVAS